MNAANCSGVLVSGSAPSAAQRSVISGSCTTLMISLFKRLTVACVARSAHEAEELGDGAERWLASGDWVLVRCDRLLVSPED